jgi:hypothetical protein
MELNQLIPAVHASAYPNQPHVQIPPVQNDDVATGVAPKKPETRGDTCGFACRVSKRNKSRTDTRSHYRSFIRSN